MASTSVHFPPKLLAELDRLAEQRGVSRNRVINEACQRVVAERVEWPTGYFDTRMSEDDLELLRTGAEELLESILAARQSRQDPAF